MPDNSQNVDIAPHMFHSWPTVLIATVTCALSSVSSEAAVVGSLRGRGHGQFRHRSALEDIAVSEGDKKIKAQDEAEHMVPLYNDFLDIMNHAVGKALQEQRAVPAYQDFLHILKEKTDKAYREQVQVPTYTDFLDGLKASSVEALKLPVPSYEEFLSILRDGADKAMRSRIQHKQSVAATDADAVDGLANTKFVLGSTQQVESTWNPFKTKKDKEDHHKLRNELRSLKNRKKKMKEEKGGLPDHVKKPLMKRINILRTQLCWQRPNLWQHEKCLRFLGIHCLKESTGEGICRKFTKEATKRCKTEKDELWRADYCALSEALSDQYGEDEEDDDDDVDEDLLEETEDEKAAGVGSDDDLDDDLDEEDKAMGVEEAIEGEGEDVIDESEGEGDGEKIAKPADRDGDGIPDSEDAFADDPSEWKDTDGDGVGDNADNDRDGDGYDDDVDAFPDDAKEWKDTDGDGIGDNSDTDRDGDSIPNDKDVFPDDPTEWKDSDGDGVGDNKDHYPFNKNCHSPTEPCEDVSAHKMPKAGSDSDPATLDMAADRPLPEDGLSEAMTGPPVKHDNYYTWVSDWQDEFPLDLNSASEDSTMARICKEHPQNQWCRKFSSKNTHYR